MEHSENHSPRVMTIKEVSEYLRIPVSTIYELASQGKLRGGKFGKHWRFLEQDILNYLHGDMTKTSGPEEPREKREDDRVNTEIPSGMTVLLTVKKRMEVDGTMKNLSVGGAYIVSPRPAAATPDTAGSASGVLPEVGDPVKVTFRMPGDASSEMEIEGRIVHQSVNGKMGNGIKFKNLSDETRGKIGDYVG